MTCSLRVFFSCLFKQFSITLGESNKTTILPFVSRKFKTVPHAHKTRVTPCGTVSFYQFPSNEIATGKSPPKSGGKVKRETIAINYYCYYCYYCSCWCAQGPDLPVGMQNTVKQTAGIAHFAAWLWWPSIEQHAARSTVREWVHLFEFIIIFVRAFCAHTVVLHLVQQSASLPVHFKQTHTHTPDCTTTGHTGAPVLSMGFCFCFGQGISGFREPNGFMCFNKMVQGY